MHVSGLGLQVREVCIDQLQRRDGTGRHGHNGTWVSTKIQQPLQLIDAPAGEAENWQLCFWAKQCRTFFPFGPRVQDFLGLRIPKMSIWQVWVRSCSKSKLLKGVLTGSRKPRFSRILGVLSVLDCLLTLGTKSTSFSLLGQTVHNFFCVWTKSTRPSHAQDNQNEHLPSLG